MSAPALTTLIPHQGAMCLLDSVVAQDAISIRCTATSHHSLGNPLRRGGMLPAIVAAEYAAQAMALHGALHDGTPQRAGFLAALRDVALYAERLDDVGAPLQVEAEALSREAEGLIYRFSVGAAGQVLAEGQIVVMFPR